MAPAVDKTKKSAETNKGTEKKEKGKNEKKEEPELVSFVVSHEFFIACIMYSGPTFNDDQPTSCIFL